MTQSEFRYRLFAGTPSMTITIVIAGKGGTGKTTIAALLINLLSEKGTVLAVDADPSTNLNLALGLPLESTVGEMREEMARSVKSGTYDISMPKPDYVALKIAESLVESEKVDLLAMGRPEGPGCYCAANSMLRTSIDRLGKNYDWVVIDCEAGMEHISRQTTREIDILLVVSDPTIRGIIAAGRMKALIGELRTQVGQVRLVVNRVEGEIPMEISKAIEGNELDLVASIPKDPNLAALEIKGEPSIYLPPDSPLQRGVREVAKRLALL
ncbi:MAG: AAA family ATPase [Dehalococcoidia bacterium]|nr:AAA family ATPase [Dehalococcoidia bacterium]